MRRFLMVSPLFPPVGAIGAKRPLLFARHLPAFGWQPAVVSLPGSIDPDPALLPLVPAIPMWRGYRGGPIAWVEDLLDRKPTAHPYRATAGAGREGALDRYARYLPWSLAGAAWLLWRERCEVIYVNAGPHSAQLLGWLLSLLSRKPLVLDLRDPWSIEPNYRSARTPAANRRVDRMERRFFLRADRIVLNTDSARDAYRARYAGVIPSERFTTIRNSFDPALYGPAPESPGPAGPFEIVYFGHLRPAKNAILFLEGFRRFIEAEGLRPGEAVLTTLGTRTAGDEEAISRLGLGDYTRTHPWVPVTEARAFLGRADLLLDLMGSDHVLQVSGKLYDYLACGRPILAVTPNEETGRILEETGAGTRVALDAGAIAAALGRQLAAKRAGQRFAPDPEGLAHYQAGPAARRLADILEDVAR